MRGNSRAILVSVALLSAAVFNLGCNQIFGLDETELAPQHAYTCECACSGGGQSFSLDNDVCLPTELNPGINPDLPEDFRASADALQNDCHIRVERNLERMARQCVADRIQCTCDALVDLNFSFACDSPCPGEDLAADCSNFHPQTGTVTATNVPGQAPVCVDGSGFGDSTRPAAFASALFGGTTECQVDGGVSVTRDGDTQTRAASGVTEFSGSPCPGGSCAVGVSYSLDHVDDFSFSGFAGFASVEFKDIAASGASAPGAALLDAQGLGALPPGTTGNVGRGKRSNQILGGETSSDSADYTGTNGAPLDVLVDWTGHSCALSGAVLGSVEDSDTAVAVDLAGTIANEPPTASAAATARTVECTSPAGADVKLDGSASSDPEDNIALFAWRRGSRAGTDIGGEPVVQVSQALGVTETYSLAVVDAFAQASEDETTVRVVDTTPPTAATATASPATIWPPNHKMVAVTVDAAAADVCGSTTCSIASVTSNEPANGRGDGNTASDFEITGPLTVDLRAERSRQGGGRVYTLAVRCSDPSGNASTATTTVAVTH